MREAGSEQSTEDYELGAVGGAGRLEAPSRSAESSALVFFSCS